MKKLIFAGVAALLVWQPLSLSADGQDVPVSTAFRPWQRVWQCNDIRVTETVNQPGVVNYDLGGTIWGGSNFTLNITRGDLYFNGRPCVPLLVGASW
jgi:hypothetical protein